MLTARRFDQEHPLAFVRYVILPLAVNDAMEGRSVEASRWLDESERLVAEVVRDKQEAGRAESFDIGGWHRGVGECLMLLGRHAEAEDRLLAAHRILVATRSAESGWTVAAINLLVALYEAWDKPAEAAAWQARLDDVEASSETEP